MALSSDPAATPFALVRSYFGLDQQTLATGLRVTREQLANYEAGRRQNAAAYQRLRPLLAALPALPAPPPADPAAGLAPPDAALLAARLDYCRHHLARLRREVARLAQPFAYARRWQQALPALLAAAPDEHTRQWLRRREAQAAADLDPLAAADYHLRRLRLLALETEAAGLAALLESHL